MSFGSEIKKSIIRKENKEKICWVLNFIRNLLLVYIFVRVFSCIPPPAMNMMLDTGKG